MENFDLSMTLPSGVETMVAAGGILLLSVIIVMIIVLKKRWHGHFMPLFLGMVSYLIFGFVCTNLFTTLLSLIPSVEAAFTYNPTALSIIQCLFATCFGLVGRFITVNMLLERYETKGDLYMAGVGYGLGDAVLFGVTTVSYYVWCLGIRTEGLATVLTEVPQEQVSQIYESILILFKAPTFLWLLLGVNAILDLLLQFAFVNVMFGIVKKNLPKYWYGIIAALSFAALIVFQVFDETSVLSVSIAAAVKLVIFGVAMYYMVSVAFKEIKYSED